MLSAVTSPICIVSIALNFLAGSIFRILEGKGEKCVQRSFGILPLEVLSQKRREKLSSLLSLVKTTALEFDLLCLLCLTVTALKTTLLVPPTLFFWRAARYADVSRFSLESLR